MCSWTVSKDSATRAGEESGRSRDVEHPPGGSGQDLVERDVLLRAVLAEPSGRFGRKPQECTDRRGGLAASLQFQDLPEEWPGASLDTAVGFLMPLFPRSVLPLFHQVHFVCLWIRPAYLFAFWVDAGNGTAMHGMCW